MSSETTLNERINACIDQIKKHQDSIASLVQLQSLIAEMSSQRLLNGSQLFKHVINDIIFIKKSNKFKDCSHHIQQHISFIAWLISCVSYRMLIAFDFYQLKQLFQLCVVNASNERERFVILDMYSLLWGNWAASGTLMQFCTEYFVPLMREYRYTSEDQMITKLFHCFHRYYINYSRLNNSLDINCVSFLNLNHRKMINCIMDQLNEIQSTPDGNGITVLQIKHLLCALPEVKQLISSKTPRVSLLNEHGDIYSNSPSNKLSQKTKARLTDIFYTFAADKDGAMSANDIRRYIIAMGAGMHSASKPRIDLMFQQYADAKGQFTLTSFLNFYTSAVVDRPQHVRDDLYMFGYNYNLEFTLYNEYLEKDEKEDDIIHFVSNHSKYNTILNTLLTQMDTNHDYEPKICESILSVLVKLPKCTKMQKQMYDLGDHESLDSLLGFDDNDMNRLNRMMYNVVILYSLHKQMGQKWKEMFIKRKGVDYLLNMLIQFGYAYNKNRDYYKNSQCYHLSFAFLMKIVHQVCDLSVRSFASLNGFIFHMRWRMSSKELFLQDVMNALYPEDEDVMNALYPEDEDVFVSNLIHDPSTTDSEGELSHSNSSMNEFMNKVSVFDVIKLKENHLVNLICLDARASQNHQMEFLYNISQPIGYTYFKPLILGYIHECETAQNIPNDIVKLLSRFFC